MIIGLSGMISCDCGPVGEAYDDTKPDGTHPALMGYQTNFIHAPFYLLQTISLFKIIFSCLSSIHTILDAFKIETPTIVKKDQINKLQGVVEGSMLNRIFQ